MTSMLARAAENIYWMGRLLERASGLCRKLDVSGNVAVEVGGLDPKATLNFLGDMHELYPGSPKVPDTDAVHERYEAVLQSFLLGNGNDLSVAVSLRLARENAKAVRDYLSREVFESINAAWLELSAALERGESASTVLPRVQQHVFAVGGAMGRSMLRDESWAFMDLGVMLERLYRVLLVVAYKLPAACVDDGSQAIPVRSALLRGVLRSGASLENYRRVKGVNAEPEPILAFLLFDRQAPHSVAHGLRVMERALDSLGITDDGSEVRRRTGLLSARMRYSSQEGFDWRAHAESCKEISDEIIAIHDALTRKYFAV
jgi:uncharacterized alpha-E superfamily protein